MPQPDQEEPRVGEVIEQSRRIEYIVIFITISEVPAVVHKRSTSPSTLSPILDIKYSGSKIHTRTEVANFAGRSHSHSHDHKTS